MLKHKREIPSARAEAHTPLFRSAAVARMTLMPVATLRVWEQRYQAVRPATMESGHRLYDLEDVQRVLLLRQLTQHGHAISLLAPLNSGQLQALARQCAGIAQEPPLENKTRGEALRLVVVGENLAERLRRPVITQHAAATIDVVAEFATLADAIQAQCVASRSRQSQVDALLWQSPGLQPNATAELEEARAAWAASRVAVLYRYAGAAARKALSETGVILVREQTDDNGLGIALASLASRLSSRPDPARPASRKAATERSALTLAVSAAPRRFSDAVLTAMASHPSTSACECPRHVAELLMQIASFESYSVDCANQNPEDSEIHEYLHQVSGVARQLFESAIEVVARHEGLPLR